MSADVISLDERRPPENRGTGAREALNSALATVGSALGTDPAKAGMIIWSDRLLMELWIRGFWLGPLTVGDDE